MSNILAGVATDRLATAMFKLTKQEQVVVALVVGAVLLGSMVREWRGRDQREGSPAVTMEKRER